MDNVALTLNSSKCLQIESNLTKREGSAGKEKYEMVNLKIYLYKVWPQTHKILKYSTIILKNFAINTDATFNS